MTPSSQPTKILLLGATPWSQDRLDVEGEFQVIEDEHKRAPLRSRFMITPIHGLKPGDLQRRLIEIDATVVHFSGHGSRGEDNFPAASIITYREATPTAPATEHGLIVRGSDPNDSVFISVSVLKKVFEVVGKRVRLVVLNACYTSAQAKVLADVVDFVIGFDGPLSDAAARAFAAGFYHGLGHGFTIRDAFDLGRNQIDLTLKDHEPTTRPGDYVPHLHVRPNGADPTEVVLEPLVRPGPSAPPLPAASIAGVYRKNSRLEFMKRLDRDLPWLAFVRSCERNEHLVMCVTGDAKQSLELFHERVRNELPMRHGHVTCSFGWDQAQSNDAELAERMRDSVNGYYGDNLTGAICVAASERPVMFMLQYRLNEPLDDERMGEQQREYIIDFVRNHFLPALARSAASNHVRMFLTVRVPQYGKSRLVAALEDVVKGTNGVGWFGVDELSLPQWNDVQMSINAMLEPYDALSREELDCLKAVYRIFIQRATGPRAWLRDLLMRVSALVRGGNSLDHRGRTFRDLAEILYPLYQDVYQTRERMKNDEQ
jgi:hypothetical protein